MPLPRESSTRDRPLDADPELLVFTGGGFLFGNSGYQRQAGPLMEEPLQFGEFAFRTGGHNLYGAVGEVFRIAPKSDALGVFLDEKAKPDTLHSPAYDETFSELVVLGHGVLSFWLKSRHDCKIPADFPVAFS